MDHPDIAYNVENTHVREFVTLETPAALKERIPNRAERLILATRADIAAAIHGRDDRLVMVVGPCSIHDVEAAHEYAGRLQGAAGRYEDELIVVMRTYFEKPRTTVGWTGLVYDPQLDGSEDIPTGLELSRRLLADLNESGVPCAVELLDPITPQYYADLVSWAAIGARTVESQVHRQLASGLSMPLGFKNSTDGRISVAVHALEAASRPHSFFGVDAGGKAAMVRTAGNPDVHLVLRGGVAGTNFHPAAVEEASRLAEEVRSPYTDDRSRLVMVDCSHGNSGKDHRRQPDVARAVFEQVAGGAPIVGVMLESHLHEGRQDWTPQGELRYGVSITDGCIGWEITDALLGEAAAAVRSARA